MVRFFNLETAALFLAQRFFMAHPLSRYRGLGTSTGLHSL